MVYVPAFNTIKNFHYNDHARSLGAATPTTSSLKNSWTCKSLTYSRKNNICKHTRLPRPYLYDELPQELYTIRTHKFAPSNTMMNLGDLYTLNTINTLTTSSYRIDIEMEKLKLV